MQLMYVMYPHREDYQQLVYQALSYKKREIKLLPPTILKPCALWSGKQIISTVIINIIPQGQHPVNVNSRAKISDNVSGLVYIGLFYINLAILIK